MIQFIINYKARSYKYFVKASRNISGMQEKQANKAKRWWLRGEVNLSTTACRLGMKLTFRKHRAVENIAKPFIYEILIKVKKKNIYKAKFLNW